MQLLVIRTSAMGDVVLTALVISALVKKYPDVTVTLVTRKAFVPFFNPAKGLRLFTVEFKGRHKGLTGVFRLYSDLRKQGSYDHVVDLHDVIRTKILRLFFRITGTPVSVIDKGRNEKRDLVSGRRKLQLKHTVIRYCDVFTEAGFPVGADQGAITHAAVEANDIISGLPFSIDVKNIGVAPFARHSLKMWPEEYMTRLLVMIAERHDVNFWLFGGAEELERLNKMSKLLPGSFVASGKLDLAGEMTLMKKLDMMISMDSSNMHMADLCGIKVISIWGATDPLAGFGAWQQPDEYSVRIPVEELGCRPCTVYGKGECRRKDFACMIWLTPERVYDRMIGFKII